jgi:hypothetical protein
MRVVAELADEIDGGSAQPCGRDRLVGALATQRRLRVRPAAHAFARRKRAGRVRRLQGAHLRATTFSPLRGRRSTSTMTSRLSDPTTSSGPSRRARTSAAGAAAAGASAAGASARTAAAGADSLPVLPRGGCLSSSRLPPMRRATVACASSTIAENASRIAQRRPTSPPTSRRSLEGTISSVIPGARYTFSWLKLLLLRRTKE